MTIDRVFRPGILATLIAVTAACGPPRPTPLPPNVVVVTLDTLRADHVGAYGGSATTPTLDRLAEHGLLFERAIAPLPETRPSHATLMTSTYPRHSGVVSNSHRLPEEALTLAEVYHDLGYQTGAFVGCALFGAESGFQQGFDRFADTTTAQRPAHEVVPIARAWLSELDRHRPFFLWIHLFDPHMPYAPPDPPAPGPGEADVPAFTWPILMRAAERNNGNVPTPLLLRARALYRAEVEHMDRQLGLALRDLEGRPDWDRTIVVATADHGECFGNGIYFDHSYCLGEGALAIPLLLRAPGVRVGERESAVVELLDVAPTLLRLSGIDVPREFAGRGLLARAEGPPSDAFFQHPFYRADALEGRLKVFDTLKAVAGEPVRIVSGGRLQAGVRRQQLKLVLDGDSTWLGDLNQDPEEHTDFSSERPDITAELEAAVRAWLARTPIAVDDPATINPELRRRLEALGYL